MRTLLTDEEIAQITESIGPVLVMRHQIEMHTRYRPTALMLPLSLAPRLETAWGMPVIRGDRVALVYEAPR
jgi:hypothetical protein